MSNSEELEKLQDEWKNLEDERKKLQDENENLEVERKKLQDERENLEVEHEKIQEDRKNLENRIKWIIISSVIGSFFIIIGILTLYSGKLIGILILGVGSIALVIAGVLLSCSKKEEKELNNKTEQQQKKEPTTTPPTTTPPTTTPPTTTPPTTTDQPEPKSEDRIWTALSCSERAFKLIGIIILVFGLTYVICVANLHHDLYGLGIVGLGSFVVVLAAAFCLSDKWDLREGEFRKALTISVGAVYFYSLALADKIYTYNATSNITGTLSNATIPLNSTLNQNVTNGTIVTNMTHWTIVEPLFNNLWAVFLAIISFYFVNNWIDKYKGGGQGGEGQGTDKS